VKANPTHWTSLVTGGCGYIGRHLCLRLLALGHHVFIVDDLSHGIHPDVWLKEAIRERRTDGDRIIYTVGSAARSDAPTVTFLKADLVTVLSRQLQAGATSELAPGWPAMAATFHLATTEGTPQLLGQDPLRVARKLALDSTFFQWAAVHKAQIGRVVYVSPGGSLPPGGPHHATSLLSTLSAAGEKLARLAAARYGLRVASVRPSTVYGKDQGPAALLPTMAHEVLAANDELELSPAWPKLSDLLHIDDCIALILRASEFLSDGETLPIGSGHWTSTADLARLMTRAQGRQLSIRGEGQATPAPPATAADPARMSAKLGAVPSISLPQALAQVLRTAQRRQERLTHAPVPAASAHGAMGTKASSSAV
jgi:nucleoside-diphosphate-sugar epimerase